MISRARSWARARVGADLVGVLLLVCTAQVWGQQPVVKTGLSRDTIRVGDPFRAVVSIALPPGTDAVLPDSLVPTEDIENAGKVRMRRDSANGALTLIAAYPLTAWRPGSLTLPDLGVVLRTATGERRVTIKLPAVPVLSVLPADTAGITPKPPKDVIGGNRLWWPWILAALLLLIALAAAYWWYRKRRRPREPELEIAPIIMPRARALEELDRIRALRLVEQGELKQFYTLLSTVLRQYIATVEPAFGLDLTTEELARTTGTGTGTASVRPAIRVLRSSDLVKFARSSPSAADAYGDWERARDWIGVYPAPAPATSTAERAA